jgi:hypothetical protein
LEFLRRIAPGLIYDDPLRVPLDDLVPRGSSAPAGIPPFLQILDEVSFLGGQRSHIKSGGNMLHLRLPISHTLNIQTSRPILDPEVPGDDDFALCCGLDEGF